MPLEPAAPNPGFFLDYYNLTHPEDPYGGRRPLVRRTDSDPCCALGTLLGLAVFRAKWNRQRRQQTENGRKDIP